MCVTLSTKDLAYTHLQHRGQWQRSGKMEHVVCKISPILGSQLFTAELYSKLHQNLKKKNCCWRIVWDVWGQQLLLMS